MTGFYRSGVPFKLSQFLYRGSLVEYSDENKG